MGNCFIFPEGASPLNAGVNPEVLASGKLVYREVWSEGSQTAKVGADTSTSSV